MEEPRRLGGRYELGQVLGRGGMAEVFLAHDTRLGRTVAVKTLRVDLARDPTFQARFRREAQSAASLNHPAIVAVYDTGEDYVDGISIPYIVMEYVDGSTLRELLHSGRKLLPERTLEMCIGILQALEYSHRNGIVHRDIKPANVMLTRTGQVKVMDFGIARAMGDSGMTMTQTAAVIGTAQYLSPEQAKGETVDARSDLYSTGCLLYELLTVRPPFIGDSPVAVAYQHVREEPQPPSVYDPEITPDTDAIVLKALTKDPDYRYQSADEMRADIEASLDGRPVAAAAALGAVGYGYDDRPTQALRPQPGGPATAMMPAADEGYGGRAGRRQKKNSNTSTILLVVAGILVLIGAIFIGAALFGNDPPPSQVKVPSFAGLTFEEAEGRADNGGLEAVQGDSKPCDEEEGTVCETDPPEGTEVNEGDVITMIMSEGPAAIEVPDVVGEDYDSARGTLEDAGFQVDRETEVTTEQEDGTVLRQSPGAGEEAQRDDTIVLTVATAPDTKEVTDVVNLSYDDAKRQLEQDGFTVVRRDAEDSRTANTVIAQEPRAGQQREPGTQVVLTVAIPPEEEEEEEEQPAEFALPDYAGQNYRWVREQLKGFGIKVESDGPDGPRAVIERSDPPAGSTVKEGDTVRFFTTRDDGGSGFIGGIGDDD
ncbi:Stk1 family PASTA domain-containing Ser/Thr kinase [Streptomyces sp. ACA25]|uniref:Stk1 family PASTA domain-containing Ser/Thr kinase n=1 Tax=Streptomyces sp. ACA25 TaxID=3022596 RepID=UPI00230763F6|nr:Stk1 family PASTA domain-containing Ser/Thr kinase [Streptomyces sp. ACA25]MDB1086282.1 Stk1 family PASTA domain-containing Ser/Thr kinase [Streptomyces sp. ACA25]